MRDLVADEDVERWHTTGFLAHAMPLVGPAEVDQLRALVEPLVDRWPALPPGHAQALSGDEPAIREIVLATRLAPRLLRSDALAAMTEVATTLLGCGAVRHHFDHVVAKPPGAPATAWHQDVAFDPEFDVPLATVWVPLVDVDDTNGAMRFLPGSHTGPIVTHERVGAHGRGAIDVDVSGAVTCPVAAGACTVHMARTLHGSTPNTGDVRRIAWVVKFVPDGRHALRRAVSARRERRRPLVAREG